MRSLRDLFGRRTVSAEDALRLDSIRSSHELRAAASGAGKSLDDFLMESDAWITFSSGNGVEDARSFELLNKTNQFNLNGRHMSASDWQAYFRQPGACLLTVSYADKYGPLGKIAVVLARVSEVRVEVEAWAMSCRAFSRRIEHQTLRYLFEKFSVQKIALQFQETARNQPVREFLTEILGGPPGGLPIWLTKSQFEANRPPLHHQVREAR